MTLLMLYIKFTKLWNLLNFLEIKKNSGSFIPHFPISFFCDLLVWRDLQDNVGKDLHPVLRTSRDGPVILSERKVFAACMPID